MNEVKIDLLRERERERETWGVVEGGQCDEKVVEEGKEKKKKNDDDDDDEIGSRGGAEADR